MDKTVKHGRLKSTGVGHPGLGPDFRGSVIEARVSRSFDEMITIDLVESTLTIRLQTCAMLRLAIAKPTPRGC